MDIHLNRMRSSRLEDHEQEIKRKNSTKSLVDTQLKA